MDKPRNVLILDDEQNILFFLEKLFRNEPYAILTTTNHEEALAILDKEKSIKVVMSDQSMPAIAGVEFLKIVKSQYPDIVRMLFTAHADIEAAKSAINIGEVYRFILKPWNTEDLKSGFRQAMEHYDLTIENKNYLKVTETKNRELKMLNAKLKSMYETQKEFTSTVSHELKTPLASIKSTVDLVLSQTPGQLNPDQMKFLTKTKNNVDRLNHLISDILDLARLESGKKPLAIQPNPIYTIIQEVLEIKNPQAKAKQLYLKNDCAENLPPIPCDAEKIHQVLCNLVDNAIKFTDSGGINICCDNKSQENHFKLCVKDTGEGIHSDDYFRIFEKFEQLGDPLKHASGTGLGLALCKEIIERHGGKIWIESEKGKGSNFFFVLPLEERRNTLNRSENR